MIHPNRPYTYWGQSQTDELPVLKRSGFPTGNLVYAAAFDPRIGSNRGVVEKSLYTSDFSADADGWTSDALITLTGNIDSIDGENDNLELAYGASGTEQVTLPTTLSVGCLYKITFDAYHPAANVTLGSSAYAKLYNNLTSVATIGTTEGSWESVSATFKAQASSLWIGESLTATNGDKLYIRNVTIKQVIKNPVVHVLRDSDSSYRSFTAPEVASGVMLNWVTDGAPTANGLIHTAYDPSGNGNDATQTTVANMPKIVDAGTLVTDSGVVMAQFTAANATRLNYAENDLNPGNTISVFVVQKDEKAVTETSGWMSLRNTSSSTNRTTFELGVYNNANFRIRHDPGADNVSVSDTFATAGTALDTLTLMSVIKKSDGTLLGYEDGAQKVNLSVSDNSDLGSGYGITIGKHDNTLQYAEGKLAAVFVFFGDMSSQRPAIEAALANIYGITLS